MSVIGFHNPDEENGYMSNWYISNFSLYEVEYNCVEQCMMHSKAMLFRDYDIAEKIMKSNSPSEIKMLGRMVSGFKQKKWDEYKYTIVYSAVRNKFAQNKDIRDQLLSTRGNVLAECALRDKVWGIGLAMGDPNVQDVSMWRGENLLGFILMGVREQLLYKTNYKEVIELYEV